MATKKSLQIALQKAQEMSAEYPDTVYYVMDKKGKTAAVHASDWVRKEKVLIGWHTVCRFKNGQKM